MRFAFATLVTVAALGGITWAVASALRPAGDDPYGDISGVKLLKPEDKVDVKSVPPPAGASVLFDGKNLDGWLKRGSKKPAAWQLLDNGVVQANKTGDIVSKQTFDYKLKLHVEFRVPYLPRAKGQARGNSGVYLQGRYEIQILDSYGLEARNDDCGAVYGVAAPLVNACKAPTVWQSYDIEFTPPTCANGKKTAPARVTVYQNGVKIHDNVKITKDNTTAGMGGDVCTPGPILLQDHGSPVQFRNVWLLKNE